MSRHLRGAAATAAVLLALEGMGLGVLHWTLAVFVEKQAMSLDGLAPGTLALAARIGGVLLAGFLLLCAGALLRTARHGRAPGRIGRALTVGCAVAHGVLGVLAVALVGWGAFALLMAVLGLLVWVHLGSAAPRGSAPAAA